MQLHVDKGSRGAFAIIDYPASLEANGAIDHKLEGFFYGHQSVANPLAFSLGSPSTCAVVPGPWLTCSLQATESVYGLKESDGQIHQKHRDLRFIRPVTHWWLQQKCLGDTTLSLCPTPFRAKYTYQFLLDITFTEWRMKAPLQRASWPASSQALMFTGSDQEATMHFAVTWWLLSNGSVTVPIWESFGSGRSPWGQGQASLVQQRCGRLWTLSV